MISTTDIPAHVAIVMDGNGRWAEKRNRPRTFGHQAGLKALRKIVEHSGKRGVKELTIFAFSSENWNRPKKEVSRLMDLFMRALDREAKELHENGVRIRFIGDLTAFKPEMQRKMEHAMALTAGNTRHDSERGRKLWRQVGYRECRPQSRKRSRQWTNQPTAD